MTTRTIRTLLNLYKKYEYKLFLFLTLLTGFTPLCWFDGRMIAGEEFYALDYAKWGQLMSKAWSTAVNFGEASLLNSFKFQQLFFEFLYFLGISKYLALVTWYLLLWIVPAILVYLLLMRIFKRQFSGLVYFLATCFYVYNPFFLNISPTLAPPRLVYLIVPILFHIFLFYHERRINRLCFVVFTSFLIFVFSPIFVNIPAGLAVVMLVAVFTAYEEIFIRRTLLQFLCAGFGFALLFILLNIWWLVPTAIKTVDSLEEIKSTTGTFTAVNSSNTFDVISLFGSWAFREKVFNTDIKYFDHHEMFDKFPGVVFRYVPFILVLFAFLNLIESKQRRLDRFLLFVLGGSALFLFLSKGASGPDKTLFQFIHSHIPPFWIFREPYLKFIPILSIFYTLSIPLGVEYYTLKFTSKLSAVLGLAALFLMTAFLSYPYISDLVIWDKDAELTRSYKITIPSDYALLSDGREKGPLGYYMQFPSAEMFSYYKWESGYIGNPFMLLSNFKTINPIKGYSTNERLKPLTSYLYSSLFNRSGEILDRADRFNLGGIIAQKDTLHVGFGELFDRLAGFYGDKATLSTNHFDIYKLSDPEVIDIYENPSIYKMNKDLFYYYPYIISLLPKESFISISDGSAVSDINHIQLTPDNNGAIWLGKTSNDSETFSYYVYDAKEDIKKVEIDGNALTFTNKLADATKIYLGNECKKCEITLSTDAVETQPELIEDDWLKVDRLNVADGVSYKGPKLIFSDANTSYFLKISDFNPASFVQIGLRNSSNNQNSSLIEASIVEVDKNRNSAIFLTMTPLTLERGFTGVNYANIPEVYKSMSASPEYYVALYIPSNYKLEGTLELNVPEVMKFVIYPPALFEIKNNNNKPVKTKAVYEQVNDSLYKIKVSGTQGSFIHFKQTYNKFWRLVSLDDAGYTKLSKSNPWSRTLTYATGFLKGEPPQNIEEYSNGWVLEPTTDDRYYAILFCPALFAEGFLYLSVLVAFISLGGCFIWRKKCY